MRTNTYTSALLTFASFLIAVSLNASSLNFNEEEYIDDIPFNTELVVEKLNIENSFTLVDFEDEAFVNDIPFNTEEVVENYYNENDSLSFFEEEAYINDIPFNTEEIVAEYNYQEALYANFDLTDEKYIDDIPFDTFNISREFNREYVPVFYSVVVTPLEF